MRPRASHRTAGDGVLRRVAGQWTALKAATCGLAQSGATPHAMALGLAFGIFMANTPFLGLQLLGAVGLAWLFGASVPAAVLGTFWANPITYPMLLVASYRLGAAVLPGDVNTLQPVLHGDLNSVVAALLRPGRASLERAFDILWPVAKPLTLGALLLGLASALICYCAARRIFGLIRVGHDPV